MGIFISILILCGVIMFHELGHFLLARACHITVVEFAFGMGPKILSFKKGETTYAWRAIPIGGMCQMLGEDENDNQPGSFQNAKVWQRALVVAFGPLFNFILAFFVALVVICCVGSDPARVVEVDAGSPEEAAGLQEGDIITRFENNGVDSGHELYSYIMLDGIKDDIVTLRVDRDGEEKEIKYAPALDTRYMLGFSYQPTDSPATLTEVTRGLPMDLAGMKKGDTITGINGVNIATFNVLAEYMADNPLSEKPVDITYERNGVEYELTLTPVKHSQALTGFAFNLAREKQDFLSSMRYAAAEIKYNIRLTIKSLISLFTGRFGIQDLSGPVGIVSAIDDVYTEAQSVGMLEVVMSMLNMLILISANLGVMNLLPIPALDGGRLLFLLAEAITRKKVNQRIEGAVHFAGFVIVMGLAVIVAVNDVFKLL